MNIRIPLLATLFGGILTVSTQAQTITAPTGQNLTITNPVDVTGAGNGVSIPADGVFKIGGVAALRTKGSNLFVGEATGTAVTTGIYNSFQGLASGSNTTTGNYNTFYGLFSGLNNVTGTGNVFFGTNAGQNNAAGDFNVFLGYDCGKNTTANRNSFFGTSAGYFNTTGTNNIAFGSAAGVINTVGNNNTYLGTNADAAVNNLSNATAIGANTIVNASNTVVLGNGATTITGTGLAGSSGLKFANLTSGSAATPVGGNKVLSVNATGDVVLVTLTSGTINSVGGPVAEKTWKDQDGYLYNNSTNGVVINGTGLDGNSLIVKGGVLSKEVNVKVEGSESWPDYVFKPSYKRMTLDEVEKFININGHLPNVASATEMAATGNNLNKTDIKLLEKVEELTLYLLEMKKSNEAQNAEIQNLKKQVKSLRKK
jgi:trimeric autotransporter adhesin